MELKNACWVKKPVYPAASALNANSSVPTICYSPITHTQNSFICLPYQPPCETIFQINSYKYQPVAPLWSLAYSTPRRAAAPVCSLAFLLLIFSLPLVPGALCFPDHRPFPWLLLLRKLPSPSSFLYFHRSQGTSVTFPYCSCFSSLVACIYERPHHSPRRMCWQKP